MSANEPQFFGLDSEQQLLDLAYYNGIDVEERDGSYHIKDKRDGSEQDCQDFTAMEKLLWKKIP